MQIENELSIPFYAGLQILINNGLGRSFLHDMSRNYGTLRSLRIKKKSRSITETASLIASQPELASTDVRCNPPL